MVTPLNLYATKIFAEHPLSLWALDDVSNYISLLNVSEQDLSGWTSAGVSSVVDAYGGSPYVAVPPPTAPFKNEYTNGVIGTVDNLGTISFESPRNYQPSDFSSKIKTVGVSVFVYSYTKVLDVRVGIRWTDPDNPGTPNEAVKSVSATSTLSWSGLSETFELPKNFEDLKFFLEFFYRNDSEVYEFAINGISVGQWSEEHQLESLGVRSQESITSLNIANVSNKSYSGVAAKQYGLEGSDGYYLIKDNYLLAKNSALPIIYGTRNSTRLTPSSPNEPSLIIPGFNFMNSSGSGSQLTAEFWIKIASSAVVPRKIFGPVGSLDGIYVDGPFLKLRVGGQFVSHFVREWDRPMLINIRLDSKVADLVVNGSTVGSIDRTQESYSFPPQTNSLNQELNWLGFYCYEDVPALLLDCIAIYPYMVANDVSKRRWVYGQAVESPSDIKGLNTANSVNIDYSFANYAKNYNFPRNSNWSGGIVDNLSIEEDALKMPIHPLPEAKFNKESSSNSWLQSLALANSNPEDTFISLRPDLHFANSSNSLSGDSESIWQETEGYLVFNNMNFLSEETRAFYGIFQTAADWPEKQTLFKIVNNISKDYVEIYLDQVSYSGILETNVIYSFNFLKANGEYEEDIFYQSRGQHTGDRFLVGLDITRFVRDKGDKLASFFGNRQRLSFYIGGNPEYQNTYKGLIRRIGFCNARNLTKIQHFFSDYGVPVDYENVFNSFGDSFYDAGADYFGSTVDGDGNAISPPPSYWSLILDGGDPYDFVTIGTEEHTATYTLQAKKYLNNFYLDIGCNSYWEDYLPLSYFSKDLVDGTGDVRSSLSFIQFNLGCPIAENVVGEYFNLNGSMVKAFVSFQYLQSGASSTSSSFLNVEQLGKNKVVRPGSEWLYSKYEVVNGAVIYPPSGVNFDSLALKLHLEFDVESISTNPFVIRSLELASQAFTDSPTRIGTKTGKDIIPLSKAGLYSTYRNVSPFSIYKSSSPYLYNTASSGIQMLGEFSNSFNSKMSVAINGNAANFFKIGSMQMALRYSEDLMPQVPVKIFEIESAEGFIDFYLISDSVDRTRGQIYAISRENKNLQSGIFYFTNGKPTKRPILYPNSWMFLGISFPEFLDFGRSSGALRFTSPIRFDNISFYETSKSDDSERFGFRQWFSVRNNLGEDLEWGYWAGKEQVGDETVPIPGAGFVWDEVLKLSALIREEIDGETIFNIYTGTQRIVADSTNTLQVKDYEYNIFKDLTWQQNAVTPT